MTNFKKLNNLLVFSPIQNIKSNINTYIYFPAKSAFIVRTFKDYSWVH